LKFWKKVPIPLKILPVQVEKIIGRIFMNILGKNEKFGEEKQKNLNLKKIFSNFEAGFGDLCDYHKTVTKFLEIFMTP